MIKDIISEYALKRKAITDRLKDFKAVWQDTDRRIFIELCFCICTPQSRAVICDRAVTGLAKSGVLFKGDIKDIRSGLTGVRFPNNKSKYIMNARDLFIKNGSVKIKDKIDILDIKRSRRWLVEKVKGIGLKEASHFLRNVGLGADLAILDVHILRNMVKCGLIKDVPANIGRRSYMLLEDELRRFSKKIKIPMAALDLLFWSRETGEIFK